jgi:hypothetical protein
MSFVDLRDDYSRVEHELGKVATAYISLQLSGRDNVFAAGGTRGDVSKRDEGVVLATVEARSLG